MPRLPTCIHKNKNVFQCGNLNMQDVRRFHEGFYSSKNKIEQDSSILKYTTTESPKRKRSRKDVTSNTIFIRYFMPRLRQETGLRVVPVCQKTFMSILAVTKSRIQSVCKAHFINGTAPKENRGGDTTSCHYQNKKML